MKTAFVHFYDKVNLGDDLFLETLVNRYPHVRFYALTTKRNIDVFSECKNLKIIALDGLFCMFLKRIRPSLVSRIERRIKHNCEAVIYIGGSIFIEYAEWKNILNWWNYTSSQYPLFILGANFGPYSTDGFRCGVNEMLGKARDICWRDSFSYKLFPNTRYAPDILFSLPAVETEKKKQVFFSVIDLSKRDELSRYNDIYRRKMCELAESFLADGYEIAIASFCNDEQDTLTVDYMEQQMRCNSRIHSIRYDGKNRVELLRTIAESEAVIGTRFHAIILSITFGVPVFPICYSEKTVHVLDDIPFENKYVKLPDLENLSIDDVRSALKIYIQPNSSKLARNANKHFEKLDFLLKENTDD